MLALDAYTRFASRLQLRSGQRRDANVFFGGGYQNAQLD